MFLPKLMSHFPLFLKKGVHFYVHFVRPLCPLDNQNPKVDTEYKKVDKVDIDIDWLINHKTLRDTKINRNHLSHALMHYIMYFFLL